MFFYIDIFFIIVIITVVEWKKRQIMVIKTSSITQSLKSLSYKVFHTKLLNCAIAFSLIISLVSFPAYSQPLNTSQFSDTTGHPYNEIDEEFLSLNKKILSVIQDGCLKHRNEEAAFRCYEQGIESAIEGDDIITIMRNMCTVGESSYTEALCYETVANKISDEQLIKGINECWNGKKVELGAIVDKNKQDEDAKPIAACITGNPVKRKAPLISQNAILSMLKANCPLQDGRYLEEGTSNAQRCYRQGIICAENGGSISDIIKTTSTKPVRPPGSDKEKDLCKKL